LKDNLLRILSSQNSATSIRHCRPEASVIAVAIDVLRAAIDYWAVFMRRMEEEVGDLLGYQLPFERYLNGVTLGGIKKVPRDLLLAFQYSYNSLESLIRDGEKVDKAKLEAIKLEVDVKIEVLQNRVCDLFDRIEINSQYRSANRDADQTYSVKRLTVLAAIFLPISIEPFEHEHSSNGPWSIVV
jgi:hypothetical protein